MTRSVRVMKHSRVDNLWEILTLGPFSDSLKDLTVVNLIEFLVVRHRFFVHDTLNIKNVMKIDLMLDMLFLVFCVTLQFAVLFLDHAQKSMFHHL